MKPKLILIILLSLSSFCQASDISKIITVLKQTESNGDIKAIGDNGKAFGILQIHKICIDDVNRIYGTDYTHQDAFNEHCAEEIFTLYINAGIKRFVKRYSKQPTEQDIVRMWNGGFYKGYRKKTTIKYYRRYLRFKSLIK